MSYFTGSLVAVPTANKQAFVVHSQAIWPIFRSYGAARMVAGWGVDVLKGKVTDFWGAVQAQDNETVVFSWIVWPDQATADAAWDAMRTDPAMTAVPEMPFDGARMIFGGFVPVFQQGIELASGYIQGFLLAVPDQNKAAYEDMAAEAWPLFHKGGALGTVEGWGVDVPHGAQTDFYRATKAEDGEVVVFSWIIWPDRATCAAATAQMEADMPSIDMTDMPFDGVRMMWGGFEPVFNAEAGA